MQQQCACSMLKPSVSCRSVQGRGPRHHLGQYHQAVNTTRHKTQQDTPPPAGMGACPDFLPQATSAHTCTQCWAPSSRTHHTPRTHLILRALDMQPHVQDGRRNNAAVGASNRTIHGQASKQDATRPAPCAQRLGSSASRAQLLPTDSLQHPGDNHATSTAHNRQRADAVWRKASRSPETRKSLHKPGTTPYPKPALETSRVKPWHTTQDTLRAASTNPQQCPPLPLPSAVSHCASRPELNQPMHPARRIKYCCR